MQLQPLNDHLIVEPVQEDSFTKAGLVLPDTHEKDRPEKGKVIAIGPGKRMDSGDRAPLGVKVGDMVLFKKYSPDEFKVDGIEYLVLSESDIIAIIE